MIVEEYTGKGWIWRSSFQSGMHSAGTDGQWRFLKDMILSSEL